MTNPDLFTVTQAAALLGVRRDTIIKKRAALGVGRMFGCNWMLTRADVDAIAVKRRPGRKRKTENTVEAKGEAK